MVSEARDNRQIPFATVQFQAKVFPGFCGAALFVVKLKVFIERRIILSSHSQALS